MRFGVFESRYPRGKRIVALILCAGLIGIIGLVLWSYYDSMLNLKGYTLDAFKGNLERRAAAVNYYFMERSSDLNELAESGAVENYYANKALGMSLEYGLLVSRTQIQTTFSRLLKKKELAGSPIYHRLLLIDKSDGILTDVNTTNQRADLPDALQNLVGTGSNEVAWKAVHTGNRAELLLYRSIMFKGDYQGVAVGFLNLEQLYNELISKGKEGDVNTFFLAIREGRNCRPILTADDQEITDGLRHTNCQVDQFISIHPNVPGSDAGDLTAISIAIEKTPFLMSAFSKPSYLYGSISPKTVILFLSFLFLILMVGLVLLFWTGHHNVVLRARLEEEERLKTEIERKNRRLQQEMEARHKVEEALRINEKKYRHLIEYAMDVIYVADESGNFTYVSPSSEKITGYAPDELIGRHYTMILAPEIREEAGRFYGIQLVKKQNLTYYELPCLTKSGKIIWIGQNVRLDIVDDRIKGFYSLARDITELKVARDLLENANNELEERVRTRTRELRETNNQLSNEIMEKKLAEQALSEQFHFLQRLIDTIPNPIYYKNNQSIYVGCNRAFESYLGVTRDRIIGRPGSIVASLEPVVIFREENKNQGGDAEIESYEARVQHRNGKVQNILVNMAIYFDNENRPAGHVFAIIDITERQKLEGQLLQSQKLESIGSLAAGIAHEINTPIQFIGDNTRFMMDSFKDFLDYLNLYQTLLDAAQAEGRFPDLTNFILEQKESIDFDYLTEEIPLAIQQSLDGVAHVARIVRSMKEFSHPGTNEKIESDINRAIENTVTVARNEWKYVAELKTDFDRELPMVPILVGEFNQVILNLITNAVHAIAEKFKDSEGIKGHITIRTRLIGKEAEIRISDNGTGIPEKIRQRVYDPFFTTKEVGRGTGQGLSVSRSIIVDKHGGQVRLESKDGEGTTFIILLPAFRDLGNHDPEMPS
jgi:two-component system, NtrC family, sensor kinase